MLSNFELSERLFLQLAVILAVGRAVGWIARRYHQPQAVGEMLGGVMVGPSVFGWAWPAGQAWLFPSGSMSVLFATSHLGLALYMFLVGLDFRTELLKERVRSAALISGTGIVVPFSLGALIGLWLLSKPGFFGTHVHAIDASLFLGAAMAVTAFPILARIVDEQRLTGTRLGTLALTGGAIDDAAAWCLLATVLSILDHDWFIFIMALGGGAGYAGLMFTVGRRWLKSWADSLDTSGKIPLPLLAQVLGVLMLVCWFTDWLGIYEVFGAFILGVVMPRGWLTTELQRVLTPLVTSLLLPLFFTYSGLNTRLDLLDSASLGLVGLVILSAACLGKGLACYAAARWSGEDHRLAMAVGALMNARGLMELIILNIGLQRGIIQPPLFTLMVVMAIVTTLIATPIYEWVYGRSADAAAAGVRSLASGKQALP